MLKVTNLTSDSNQKITQITEDGLEFDITLIYLSTQSGWYMTIEYEDFIVQNMRLCNHKNILRSFINKLPFGLLVDVIDGGEPYFLEDFISGRVNIYVLTTTEVQEVETEVYGL